jgi:dTDP-4-dehydrorhamnose 3,5-epimerase
VKVEPTALPGVLVIEPRVHRDERGFFLETYQKERFREAGIDATFVQDNHSASKSGTLRGLHLQTGELQGKLVRCVAGSVFDVAVDVRRGSPTYGRWVGVELSADNFRQVWIPPGFAHGFAVTSERAEVEYKCTALYRADAELTVRWDDPALAIRWPVASPTLSAKDASAPLLADVADRLPRFPD